MSIFYLLILFLTIDFTGTFGSYSWAGNVFVGYCPIYVYALLTLFLIFERLGIVKVFDLEFGNWIVYYFFSKDYYCLISIFSLVRLRVVGIGFDSLKLFLYFYREIVYNFLLELSLNAALFEKIPATYSYFLKITYFISLILSFLQAIFSSM